MFGEYVLLLGAPALALPMPVFYGYWDWAVAGLATEWQQQLPAFAASSVLKAVPGIDIEAFQEDLKKGLFFNSNIPQGYGLGSSGALCAAVYDRYVGEKKQDLTELKAIFAQMEGFFHGNSSGIDPLTSYCDAPLMIINRDKAQLPVLNAWPDGPGVFLLDTELPRKTGPLVQWFLDQVKTETAFKAALEKDFLPAHLQMTQAWLAGDKAVFWPALRLVSRFQLDWFAPMVPGPMRDFWDKSFKESNILFKICGAGGGGFLLGFVPDKQALPTLAELPWKTTIVPF